MQECWFQPLATRVPVSQMGIEASAPNPRHVTKIHKHPLVHFYLHAYVLSFISGNKGFIFSFLKSFYILNLIMALNFHSYIL